MDTITLRTGGRRRTLTNALYGGGGNDEIHGVHGADILSGQDGNDTLYGGLDNDNDTLYGGYGDDRLEGGAGNDQLYDGPGLDILEGGAGDDLLYGGMENDTFAFSGGSGTQGSLSRISSLGLDTIGDFGVGGDSIALSHADFGLGTSGSLSTTPGGVQYLEVADILNGTPIDLGGGGDGSTGDAIVAIGANTGSGGVSLWYTTAQEAATTANSVQFASLVGLNTDDLASTDITLIA
jgi:Ca2+-binding RTX toxin-like protein